jgi:hypothetical protein
VLIQFPRRTAQAIAYDAVGDATDQALLVPPQQVPSSPGASASGHSVSAATIKGLRRVASLRWSWWTTAGVTLQDGWSARGHSPAFLVATTSPTITLVRPWSSGGLVVWFENQSNLPRAAFVCACATQMCSHLCGCSVTSSFCWSARSHS